MSIARFVVNTGKKTSEFFSKDLQNYYYKYYFLYDAMNHIGNKEYLCDKQFEKDSKKYWKLHTNTTINPIWHDFYSSCNGIKDVRYVPENVYYAYIEPFFNRKDFCQCTDDKCYYTERFPKHASPVGFRRPETILRNIGGMFFDKEFSILKFDEAVRYLASINSGFVIKESITGTGGNRIIFVEPGVKKEEEWIKRVFKKYKKDFVIEGIIDQCAETKKLNPTSVNTIRFITFMNQDGVHLLSAVLRIGGKGSRTDNFSTGGVACGINEDGTLKEEGYDQQFNKYIKKHPNGIEFAGVKIPSYDKARMLVETLHRRFGHFRIISWDIAIGEEYNPILIEFNLTPQSIDLHQINNGPLFGNLTESVLHEVFNSKKQ